MNHGTHDGASRKSSPKSASTAKGGGNLIAWMRSRKGALMLVTAFAVIAWAKPMGLLLWARLRILTSIPKTAIADDPANTQAEEKPPVELETGLPGMGSVLIDPFDTDPHTPTSSDSPNPSHASIVPTQKSDDDSTEVQALEEVEAARRATERFRLQSAGRGLSMAVIDGRTYRIGDTLEGANGRRFVLREVLEGAAVLEHGGERFEIRMPGAGLGTAPSGNSNRR
ncbi:MAG: hypothetical protein ACO31E_07260 [Phycisphaerales bacterium]|jgi:hypothetical protein